MLAQIRLFTSGRWRAVAVVLTALGLALPAGSARSASAVCTRATDACWTTMTVVATGGQGTFHYYASLTPAQGAAVATAAIIAIHGYSHDANKTFDATTKAADGAGVSATTLVVAPLFQVPPIEADARKPCMTRGVPGPVAGDLTWSCGRWSDGGKASADAGSPSSYAALDQLVGHILAEFPGIKVVTLAGFSAGAQTVQRYAAIAAPSLPHGVRLRFVVSDPSSWVYFDPQRPVPMINGAPVPWTRCDPAQGDGLGACGLSLMMPTAPPAGWEPPAECGAGWQGHYDRWKYGLQGLPWTSPDAAAMRAAYRAADVSYLLARDDWGTGRGTAASVLDTQCGAEMQGPFRLERGLGYALYDRTVLAGARPHTTKIVANCKHNVACVFPADAARAVLFPQ